MSQITATKHMKYNGSNLSYSTCQRYIGSGSVNICTKVFQVLQILKPDENNISWISNWIKVSFSGSEPCNPKTDTHFFLSITWKAGSLKFLHNYSGYRICFRLLVSR